MTPESTQITEIASLDKQLFANIEGGNVCGQIPAVMHLSDGFERGFNMSQMYTNCQIFAMSFFDNKRNLTAEYDQLSGPSKKLLAKTG